jgi:Arc/MetJ family transcription regulator
MSTRTNIVLDDDLIAQAMERAGVKTKKAAVEAALRAYVRKPDYAGLLALAGSGVIADDYDPKALFGQVHHVAEPTPSRSATARRAARKNPRSR